MKKEALKIFTVIVLFSCLLPANAQKNTDLTGAIRLYKAGNYSESYSRFNELAKNDVGNPLVYYYLAMSAAQVGKTKEAVDNYEKVITLSAQNTTLYNYATKGKKCLLNPEVCQEGTLENKLDAFITGSPKKTFSEEVKADFEKLKIENLMREINRSNNIDPQKFKEYKDFSSMNNQNMPTNEEIGAAIMTLQNAGLTGLVNPNHNDISILGVNSSESALRGLMGGSAMNSQLIQTMLTNNMSLGF